MKKKNNPSRFPPEMLPMPEERACQSRADWKRKLQNAIRDYRRHMNKGEHNGDSMFDLTSEMQSRRVEAILNYMDEVYRRYRDLSESASHPNALREDWIWLNLPGTTYAPLEQESFILYAAAIWILDRIQSFHDLEAVCRLLTRNEDDLEDIDSPIVWDCEHDEFLVISTVHLLYERNAGLSGPEMDPLGFRKVLTNTIAASDQPKMPCVGRARFNALISMLPEEDIEQAVSQFRALFWDWTDRYFRSVKPIVAQIAEKEAETERNRLEYNRVRKEFISCVRELEAEQRRAQPKKPTPGSPLKPVLPLPLPVRPLGADPITPFPAFTELSRKSDALIDRMGNLMNDFSEIDEQINALTRLSTRLQLQMVNYGRPLRSTMEEDFGPEVAQEVNDLKISDPYAICFALLYLIESGDDMPWLYGPGIGMMHEVAEALPWGVCEYDEENDPLWFADEDDEPEPVKPSAMPDWYERKYLYHKGKDDEFPRSLAQIVYEQTGCLMPRDMHLYDGVVKELSAYGIRGKDATGLLYCMLALANSRHRDSAFNLDSDMQRLLDLEDELPGEAKTRLTYDELSEKADRQKEEIQALRKALHEAERGAKTARKELERVQSEAQTEHRELADLREYVFLHDTVEEEPEEEIEESFPYDVQRETLVFGGHATWTKTIKPMLTGNIRFLDKDKGFDSAIIRRADVVWIQANALSHSRYYAIIDAVRQFKKPVRYFSYASAVKCARQLREADRVMG